MREEEAESGSRGAAGSVWNRILTDRLTGFDRNGSCEELVTMELGELLYNKSEYIETVRVPDTCPPLSEAASL